MVSVKRKFLFFSFALSVFIAVYIFSLFLGNRKNLSYLYYALSCITIAIYFYNIASEIQVFSFNFVKLRLVIQKNHLFGIVILLIRKQVILVLILIKSAFSLMMLVLPIGTRLL